MSWTQCMGGFCGSRGDCRNFWAPKMAGVEPVERMCQKGREEPEPIRVVVNKRKEKNDE